MIRSMAGSCLIDILEGFFGLRGLNLHGDCSDIYVHIYSYIHTRATDEKCGCVILYTYIHT